ncbi:MAG: hypothetical protein K940chlam8_00107 [Chlamydiae bacterium]|nr:hypothetical protein [Chlamydiota bacterium]
MHHQKKRLKWLIDSWWVFIFSAFCFSVFLYVRHTQVKQLDQLENVVLKLETQKNKELEKQEEYLLKIQSFNDPAYVEMVLIQTLGLVPKDQMKVVY